ncbi:MAG: peroxiredoxin family protein [Myxococcota bacterium]
MSVKSLFASSFIAVASVNGGLAIWQLTQGASVLPWSGVLLANLPIAFMMSFWMLLKSVSRTSENMPALTALSVAGVVAAGLPLAGIGGTFDALPLALAVVGAVGLLLYVRWYSVFGRTPSSSLQVGKTLPSFVLEDAKGNEVSSDDFRGAPTVMLFYRGNWCPLCMAQIKEVAGLYRELDKRGAKVRLVSPQPHDNTQSLADRFDVPFDFLVDPGNRVASQLEIISPDGIPMGMTALGYEHDTVMPTVVITDAQGVILFCDQTDNYRVRPEPDVFLKVLDGHAPA